MLFSLLNELSECSTVTSGNLRNCNNLRQHSAQGSPMFHMC